MPASTASSDGESSSNGDQSPRVEVTQNGSRKRRRLSPGASDSESDIEPPVENSNSVQSRILPTQTISRIKAKATGLSSAQKTGNEDAVPATIRAAIKGNEKASFASVGVDHWLVASLANMQIKHPTKIQSAAIPEILKGRDCIGGSRTGSGKSKWFKETVNCGWHEGN